VDWSVWVWNPGTGKDLLVSKTIHTGSRAHTTSCYIGFGVPFQGLSSEDMKLTTYFHLVLRLVKSGAIPFLLLYGVVVWTGTALLIPCP